MMPVMNSCGVTSKAGLNTGHPSGAMRTPSISVISSATADTVIGGQPIAKGDKIYLSYAAANRDPAIFDEPHRFDILRPNARRHLAFGAGPHFCIGARLARLQLRILIKEIVTRMPDLTLDGEPEWLRSLWFNAIIRMSVSFGQHSNAACLKPGEHSMPSSTHSE